MPRRSARIAAAALALLVIAAGCSDDSGKTAASDNNGGPAVENPFSDNSDATKSDSKLPKSDDDIMRLADKEVEAFWKTEFPKTFGSDFKPVSGGLIPYGPDTNPEPGCGQQVTYQEIQQNAFYCPEGDFVAWDTENLTDQLLQKFGPFTLGLVMAHELGHAVQARAGTFDNQNLTTFDTEQQADCFAGAWAKEAKTNNDDAFDVSDKDLDQALAGFLTLSDGVGTPNNDPNAHGSGFQRVEAFQDGYQDGVKKCKTYENGSPNKDAGPDQFQSQDELNNGGNAPLDQLIPLLQGNLDEYMKVVGPAIGTDWTDAKVQEGNDFTTCEGKKVDLSDGSLPQYCKKEDVIGLDTDNFLPKAEDRFGDGAAALFIIEAFMTRAQVQAGLLEKPQVGGLQNDCLTGAYLASLAKNGVVSLPQDASDQSDQASLSPGDLDEVITGFLFIGDNAAKEGGSDNSPSAFRRVDALRQGFQDALDNGAEQASKNCVSTFDAKTGEKAGSSDNADTGNSDSTDTGK